MFIQRLQGRWNDEVAKLENQNLFQLVNIEDMRPDRRMERKHLALYQFSRTHPKSTLLLQNSRDSKLGDFLPRCPLAG